VYAQILADLSDAETLVTETSPTTRITAGAIDALQARVQLYRQDYPAAVAKADEVIGQGYTLADTYPELFDPEGQDTPEDIFKVIFTAQQFNWIGYYYITEDEGGSGEVGPTQSIMDAYDPDDERLAWSILGDTEGSASGVKFSTTAGAEDVHVIRFAEVLLIKAEALARQDDLAGAVDAYNPIRVRAGLPEHQLGSDVTTQAEVLAAIDQERRLELAFEGDRWPDLVRTGQAVAVLGIPAFQALFPIPQVERDVAPGLTQNPGY
jgi:starch-binding outer membrane protein, SusD/RagB family